MTSAPSRIGRSGGIGRPEASDASLSAAAASADPPAMPAAIGIRFAISIRSGGPSHPVAARNSARARSARFSPSTPGQSTIVLARRALERQLVREVDGLDDRDQRVQAVGARRADQQAQVDLAAR